MPSRILLTGFEPFGGQGVNPSEQLVKSFADTPFGEIDLSIYVLPVDRYAGPRRMVELLDELQPDAVVSFGEAGRRMALSLERLAVNLLDFNIPDNAGHQAADTLIVPEGPAAYFSTLPVRAIYNAIRAGGIPVELSMSAGTYLCNQVMYTTLHHLAQTKRRVLAGFVHVPFLPEQAALLTPPAPSIALATMAHGAKILLDVLAKELRHG